MTTVGDINSATLSNTTNSSSSNTGLSTLTSSDFMQLMITQLSNQDPLNPTDSNEMLGQISQISTLQSNTQMTQSLASLTLQQSIGAGSNLVGKTITGASTAGPTVTGTVAGVQVNNGSVYLGIVDSAGNQSTVPMSNVTQILDTNSPTTLMQQGLQSMVMQQSLGNSSSMVGKYVTATGTGNTTISGTVTGVQLINQSIYLSLDNGQSIPASTVTGFSAAPPVNTATGTSNVLNNVVSALSSTLGG
jgi:flagellar basal-body rod modification protein FlgD